MLALTGFAAAAGSGYDQNFSQAASGSTPDGDITAVSSNDPGGLNITVSLTVAGTFQLSSGDYFYGVWFGGSTPANATAEALFTNNTTAGIYVGYGSGAGAYGSMLFTLSNGGSTLSFSIAKTIVPPAASFTLNGFALYTTDNGKTGSYSWLGNNYNGGGTCTSTSCSTTSGTSSTPFNWWLVIIPVVVVVVIIIVVVALMMRRKPPAQPAMMPPMGAPDQPMGQAPPPPPPPTQ
jgi:hypothetical protein